MLRRKRCQVQIKNEIVTERLIIRDYRKEDLPQVTAMWFDKENGKYMSDPQEEYVDNVYAKALQEMEDNPDGYYLVALNKNDRQIIGTCCMFPDAEGVYDIGYCVKKEYWRQGTGSEMLEAIMEWIRRAGGMEITAEVAKLNKASNALLRKYGFAVKKESAYKKYHMNINFESYIYSLKLQETN